MELLWSTQLCQNCPLLGQGAEKILGAVADKSYIKKRNVTARFLRCSFTDKSKCKSVKLFLFL